MITNAQCGLELAARHYADMSEVYLNEMTKEDKARIKPHFALAFQSLRLWMAKRMWEIRKEKS